MDAVFEGVSATGLLVNESRARMPDVSRDAFARAWIPAELLHRVQALWDDFAARVYPYDDVIASARGRIVLDTIDDVARDRGPIRLVSVGAGFTSYPFLADIEATTEFDLPHVADAKRFRTRELIDEGLLPARDVTHKAIDLDDAAACSQLASDVAEHTSRGPTVLIVEGVLYYLSTASCRSILDLASSWRDELAATVVSFWPIGTERHPVLDRQAAWFADTDVPTGATHLDPAEVTRALGPSAQHLDVEQVQRRAGVDAIVTHDRAVPEHVVRRVA